MLLNPANRLNVWALSQFTEVSSINHSQKDPHNLTIVQVFF
ncbi:MAG: hypothetical protein ACFWUC_08920 [Oscillospiraceae bacterium]|jgi:hypothetical protein